MGEPFGIDFIAQPQSPGRSTRAILSRNIIASAARVAVNALVALALPAYLTHRLAVSTYAAWVLILQLGAYVSFLDFGVQTAIAKFVAEYDARKDYPGAGRRASAGFVIMTIAGLLGVALTLALAWQVPRLFHAMPVSLYRGASISILLIGVSLSFGLVCSVFSAIFMGMQRYTIPMAITISNRWAFTIVVLGTVFFHGSLLVMGAVTAIVNVITGLLQILAWKKYASRIQVKLSLIEKPILKQTLQYCLVLAIWSGAMLCISGLDLTLVGHYDFRQTGYYSIATMPNNLMLMILSAALGPFLPAASAISAKRTPEEMGKLLSLATRYTTILLLLIGLTLMVVGFPILRIWVGAAYAQRSLPLLRVLILANIVRNLCLPYSTMVIAVGRQGKATISPIAEDIVKVISSIYLGMHYGAMGVAAGTLIGAIVGTAAHFIVSMQYTQDVLAIPAKDVFFKSVLRPLPISLPSAVLFGVWHFSIGRTTNVYLEAAWACLTLVVAWFIALDSGERLGLTSLLGSRIRSILG